MKIKRGSTRLVFIFNKIVIKIPNNQEYRLFLNGILSNLREKRFSSMGRNDLAKVKFCDNLGLFLVMEKAQELDIDNMDWLEFEEHLRERYKDDNLKDFILPDSKPSNWGYIGNNLVKIDYGL